MNKFLLLYWYEWTEKNCHFLLEIDHDKELEPKIMKRDHLKVYNFQFFPKKLASKLKIIMDLN